MFLPSFCRVNLLVSVIFSANSFFIFKIQPLKSMVGYINMILLNILLIYAYKIRYSLKN
nr:MAG TPA: hypothetical protein [Caudoviricetes sp.]